jgi:hypothetical protein
MLLSNHQPNCKIFVIPGLDSERVSMTTIEITLSDALAQAAKAAGLLSPDAIEAMLQAQLRRQAGERLNDIWQHLPIDPLTPELEQEIMDEVRKVRAERRRGDSH